MSTSHHIYRRPFLSGRGVLALAFSDTTSNRGRSTVASGQRETTCTHLEEEDIISIKPWLGHESPWLKRSQSNKEQSVTQGLFFFLAVAKDVLCYGEYISSLSFHIKISPTHNN